MRLLRLCAFGVLALAASACSKDTDGSITNPGPLAGLRYVNLVPDTGAMDFRVMDVVGNAPNQVAAGFRAGGLPGGVTTTLIPMHQAVRAGTRDITVFMSGTTPAIASDVMFDTTFTFEANTNYTMYLYGYSRTGSTPAVNAIIVKDSVQTLTATQMGVRLLHLAPTLAPNATTNVDVWIVPVAATAPLAGTADFANQSIATSPTVYVARDTLSNLKVAVTAAGTNTPILFEATLPVGTTGNATANPIAGSRVSGSAMTAVLVPQSVAGSPATSFTTPSLIFLIDKNPPLTAP